MNSVVSRAWAGLLGAAFLVGSVLSVVAAEPIRAALYDPSQLFEINAEGLAEAGCDSWVLAVTETWEPTPREVNRLRELGAAGLEFDLWIEVGRDPMLADAHPEWMASIQGHPEWRRFHPEHPKPTKQQVVKVYPWVPIGYQEAFDAHLAKVKRILARWPYVTRVFLNDLQAAPSACGCGHPLCRWTTDYGPKKTATALGANAAAEFVRAVGAVRANLEVIPVWATECEAGDKPGLCADVGCFGGACWRDWSAQLEPLAAQSPLIGALLLQETFQRDQIGADWLKSIPSSFVQMPKRYDRPGVSADRLIAVIEGWEGESAAVLKGQRELLHAAGVGSTLVAKTRIEQSWEPRIVPLP